MQNVHLSEIEMKPMQSKIERTAKGQAYTIGLDDPKKVYIQSVVNEDGLSSR